MTPEEVPAELVKAASDGWWKASGEGLEWEDWLRAELAEVLPLHERRVREQIGADFKTEWGVRRHGFMKRMFPSLAVDWVGSEAEARHEAANPSKPGTVVTRLVGGWRDVDA